MSQMDRENSSQNAAALSPTRADYLLTGGNSIRVEMKGRSNQKNQGFWKRLRFSCSGLHANSLGDGFGDSCWRLRLFLKSQEIFSDIFSKLAGL